MEAKPANWKAAAGRASRTRRGPVGEQSADEAALDQLGETGAAPPGMATTNRTGEASLRGGRAGVGGKRDRAPADEAAKRRRKPGEIAAPRAAVREALRRNASHAASDRRRGLERGEPRPGGGGAQLEVGRAGGPARRRAVPPSSLRQRRGPPGPSLPPASASATAVATWGSPALDRMPIPAPGGAPLPRPPAPGPATAPRWRGCRVRLPTAHREAARPVSHRPPAGVARPPSEA